MGEVIELPKPATADEVLKDAAGLHLKAAVVIGETADGSVVMSTHLHDRPAILWLLACAKKAVMDEAFAEADE